ncbi:MAG TPA: exodeoxyribonuclease VII large subunit [Elusimicrobiota bacterium]|nr:exodeoxyribonuclease VII large subunit [Elusimicrobiota bacterium]
MPAKTKHTSDEAVLTISQVNQQIARVLQDGFPEPFWIVGELQGYDRDIVKAGTRRWRQVYFELIEKETDSDTAKASVKALMWGSVLSEIMDKLKGTSEKLSLQDGLKVKFLCSVDFYWPRASLQLKVHDVDPHFTLGDMERARQELLKLLKEQGLYDRNRSTEFPRVPQNIGLITSDGSAAYHDFLDELKSSGYSFRIKLWDARMQGEDTEKSVCRGIEILSGDTEVDVIIVIRGGGSRSDLIWFDKKAIALSIAGCPKPVVTGIGHEIDLSVADLVAHTYQKTPTAVAQFLIGKFRDFETALQEGGARIVEFVRERMGGEREELTRSVETWRGVSMRLLERHRARLSEATQGVSLGARRHVEQWYQRFRTAFENVRRKAAEELRVHRERLVALKKECDLKDPRRLLERGYSLLTADGRIVKSLEQVSSGTELEAQVRDGFIAARVTSKRKGVS